MKYQIVTREMLEKVANFSGTYDAKESKDGAARGSSASPGAAETSREFVEVIRLLREKLSITIGEPKRYRDGFMYAPTACPFDPSHAGTSPALFDYPNREKPTWGFKCHHDSCKDKKRVELEALLGIERPEKQNVGSSRASELVKIGTKSELYHTPDGIPYARMAVDGHYEDWPTNSKAFRESLARAYYRRHSSVPSSQVIKDAIATLDGIARFDGAEHAVHVRVTGMTRAFTSIWAMGAGTS